MAFILVFFCISKASASNIITFRPNCTRPPDGVNFVYNADARATLDILWSCLFTLLVCTWTVQHLNIPRQAILQSEKPPKGTIWQRFAAWAAKKWKSFIPKFKWMTLTLLLPEFILGKAFQDLILARRSRKAIKREFAGEEWTLTHSFYADMGGFVLKAKTRDIDIEGGKTESKKAYIYLDAGRIYIARGGGDNVLHKKILDSLPSITEDEIMDKSKGDFFVKAAALVQVLWLSIQVCVRAARGLVVSQLEIVTLAYSVCTTITYILCWYKPQGTQVPTVVKLSKPVTVDLFTDPGYAYLTRGRPRSWFATSLRLFRFKQAFSKKATAESLTLNRTDCLNPLPNDGRYDKAASLFLPKEAMQTLLDDGFVVGGLVFGALHCSAWNSAFPTPVERLLWRISSTLSTCIVPLYYLVLLFDFHIKRFRLLKSNLWLLEGVVVFSYIFARVYLLVEVFRSLGFLPPQVFIGTWTREMPHAG